MKRILVSASLVTAGAVGLQGANAPGLTRMQTSKPWSVSAALRAFYDDNYLTQPKDAVDPVSGQKLKRDSFGIEFSPGISLNLPREQTYLGLSYVYTLRYYEDRREDPVDQNHEFDLKLDHKFSPRYSLSLDESFVYSSEPDLIEATGIRSTSFRTLADAVRNRALVKFSAVVTEMIGVDVSYQNLWYDYFQDQNDARTPTNPNGTASRGALLDRFEHLFTAEGRWLAKEHTTGLLGYQFGLVNYTSSEPIADDPGADGVLGTADDLFVKGSARDQTAHYVYVGVEQVFSAALSGNVRVGAQFTDIPDQNTSDVSPYLELNGSYQYLPGSYVQVGVRHSRNATDTPGTFNSITIDQESTVATASVTHRITPRLYGTAIATFQHSVFNGGSTDGEADNIYLFGFSLDYKINEHLSAEAGYNFDRLDSDLPDRSFSRNRVFLGVRATY
jgi:hypothetical protein